MSVIGHGQNIPDSLRFYDVCLPEVVSGGVSRAVWYREIHQVRHGFGTVSTQAPGALSPEHETTMRGRELCGRCRRVKQPHTHVIKS